MPLSNSMTYERARISRSQNLRLTSLKLRQKKGGKDDLLANSTCRGFFDLLQEGLVVVDPEGVIRMANPALARILEAGPSEGDGSSLEAGLFFSGNDDARPALEISPSVFIGEPIRQYIPADFRDNFFSLIDLLSYSEGTLGPFEMEFIRADGKRMQVKATLGRMDLGGRRYSSLQVQDVTEWNEVKNTLEVAKFQLEQSYSATLEGWARTLEIRDLETRGHSERVVKMTGELGLRIGMTVEEMVHMRHGALMHDIGKIAIPDSILQKPGKLNAEEWEEMKKHPIYARDLLEKIEYLRPAIAIPYSHHEWWNGGGYPEGLVGQQIPLPARMFAVIDVYDALSNPRCYRPDVWSHDRIMSYLLENAEKQFDPDVVRVFASYS